MKNAMEKLKKAKPSRPSDAEAELDFESLLGGEAPEDMDLADALGEDAAASPELATMDEAELVAELEKRGYTVSKAEGEEDLGAMEDEESPAYESEEEDLMNA